MRSKALGVLLGFGMFFFSSANVRAFTLTEEVDKPRVLEASSFKELFSYGFLRLKANNDGYVVVELNAIPLHRLGISNYRPSYILFERLEFWCSGNCNNVFWHEQEKPYWSLFKLSISLEYFLLPHKIEYGGSDISRVKEIPVIVEFEFQRNFERRIEEYVFDSLERRSSVIDDGFVASVQVNALGGFAKTVKEVDALVIQIFAESINGRKLYANGHGPIKNGP